MTRSERRRLENALRKIKDKKHYQRLQMVFLRTKGMTQPAIAEATGTSVSTVNRAHMAYDHGGLEALEPKPTGGRINQNMTVEEEKALLDRFAQAAGAGELLNIHEMKAAYEEAIGRPTSKSTIYALLERHGWRKLMPRPHHPERDLELQKRFKKRLSCCRSKSQKSGRCSWTQTKDYVCRRSPLWPNQQPATMLGSTWG